MRVQRALRGVGAARRDRLARGALLAAAALWPALIACASQRAAVPGAAAPVWLPSATPASGALGPAPAALPPPWPAQAPVELELVAPKGAGRWTLRSAWGQVVCELPCTVPLWPQSRLWLRREVGTAEDEERVRIPDFFTYPPGGRLRAVVIPARDAAWAELPLLLGLLAAQVGWVTAASQCGAFSRKNEGLSPPACELGLDVLAAGGFVAMAGGALWYFYDREASLRVAPPAAGGARGREAVRWPGREQPRVEVEAHGGMAVPTCYLGGCADVGVGATLGGLVLLRPLPRWAFGAVGEHAQYPWDLRDVGLQDAHVTSGMLGAAGRLYVLPGAAVDPFFQGAVGAYFWGSSYVPLTALDGLFGQLATGLDVPVPAVPWLRLSGSAGLLWVVGKGIGDDMMPPQYGLPPNSGRRVVYPELSVRLGLTAALGSK